MGQPYRFRERLDHSGADEGGLRRFRVQSRREHLDAEMHAPADGNDGNVHRPGPPGDGRDFIEPDVGMRQPYGPYVPVRQRNALEDLPLLLIPEA